MNDIKKLFSLNKYFNIKTFNDKTILVLNKPSKILSENIYLSWLTSINSKTNQTFPVYIGKDASQKNKEKHMGYIEPIIPKLDEITLQNDGAEYKLLENVKCKFNIIFPHEDLMQYFIQWQRYRKYWWSSITTTPSLFTISDMKNGDERSDVNITANFNWGSHVVETIHVQNNVEVTNNSNRSCLLVCAMGLEMALITLLMDGLTNATYYLKLHNSMAPYKISFALDNQDPKNTPTLKDLSNLLHNKLSSRDISAWLPDFTLSLQSQVRENLEMGVTYTAILNDNTLVDGIFHLLNSSTMLREQVHIYDFDSYAALLCGKQTKTK
ncbi:DNA polymerase subunit gamma-2, mitochondrial-like [Danaus plexippus]|uniref:DNA polymerase subunit gamma-2, mitochondrial-like n=1 Tax=Danaus plexippus TaxID=13037 RepID=UPI002AAFD729|nr:DNA polymerase subunit gamma-2, mitochondrial-like [Danaus plexippus]